MAMTKAIEKRIDQGAYIAGRAAGLTPQQLPGLALIFRMIWEDGYSDGYAVAEAAPRPAGEGSAP